MEQFIERKIVIGLITSTEYLHKLQPLWKGRYMESSVAKHISRWCWQYFDKYGKAPGRDIEGLLYKQTNIDKDLLAEIEEDILPGLSEEYIQGDWDISYLLEQTKLYLTQRRLLIHADDIRAQIADDELLAAENLAASYIPAVDDTEPALDLSSGEAVRVLRRAFDNTYKPVVIYPHALGKLWNSQLVSGGLVALLAPEKRGKTFMLMDMAIRATRQGKRVAFFQAGDMTESQMLIRMAVHLAKKSNLEKYCGILYEPVRDCVLNQIGKCNKSIREGNIDVFPEKTMEDVKRGITFDDIKKAMVEEPGYKTCHNCGDYTTMRLGSVWMKKIDVGDPLTSGHAVIYWKKFFRKYKNQFKLSTHANGTLSVQNIKSLLDIWERRDNFLPDIIIIDYADLLEPDGSVRDFRQQQNLIWKGLRALAQQKNEPLVVTATQADANSYDRTSLKMSNFSEDKRKLAHVTAMYGLNQDPAGREKALKILRINEIVIREGGFDSASQVTVLQNLARGLPVISSYL